ncbi:MAG TPA: biotin/lipoyl-binding protein, partial [Thermoanaerobaculia bacterium]|nr:biotin/lipoyl-binding protein [Thermoanaerobaculia bacterium]
MKRKILLILLVVLLAAGAIAWGIASKRREKPLLLSGAIEARDVEVGSLTGGRVARILVEEGSRVAPGQPIVQFETDLIDLQIQQQRARIAQAEANMTKVLRGPRREEIARARALAENAERERLRQK